MKFSMIIDKLEYKLFLNSKYYSFVDLYSHLEMIRTLKILVEDLLLVPFYICNGKLYEIYDFELYIKINGSCLEKYILDKTGKKKIKDVDNQIIDKLSNCYIPIYENEIFVFKLIEYINYVLKNKELKNRIYEIFGEFDINKFYFEIY